MPSNSTRHRIPRNPREAKGLGFENQTKVKYPMRGLSKAEKRNMVMVGFDSQGGAPTRYCHFDPNTGLWVCSDS
jgi:hypothetical protein